MTSISGCDVLDIADVSNQDIAMSASRLVDLVNAFFNLLPGLFFGGKMYSQCDV
jgi:hypothetical protein